MSRPDEVLDRIVLEGDALLREGRYAEGEERAQAVLARQPRNAAGHYLLGLSALMQQRHAEWPTSVAVRACRGPSCGPTRRGS